MNKKHLLIGCAFAVALSACSSPNPTQTLDGKWQLSSLEGNSIRSEFRPTLNIDENKVFGFSGCNRYQTSLDQAIAGHWLGPIGSTKMLCPSSEQNNIEQHYLQMLASVRTAKVEAQQLELLDKHNDVIATFNTAEH